MRPALRLAAPAAEHPPAYPTFLGVIHSLLTKGWGAVVLCVGVLFVVPLLADIHPLVGTARLTCHLPKPCCSRTG